MNTKTGLTTFVLTATLLATGACGTEQPTAHSTGNPGAQTAANTAEDLVAAARRARAEHAEALRLAHGHRTGSTTSCPVTPNPANRWVRNGIFLPECTQVRTRPIRQSADDRRHPVPVTYV